MIESISARHIVVDGVLDFWVVVSSNHAPSELSSDSTTLCALAGALLSSPTRQITLLFFSTLVSSPSQGRTLLWLAHTIHTQEPPCHQNVPSTSEAGSVSCQCRGCLSESPSSWWHLTLEKKARAPVPAHRLSLLSHATAWFGVEACGPTSRQHIEPGIVWRVAHAMAILLRGALEGARCRLRNPIPRPEWGYGVLTRTAAYATSANRTVHKQLTHCVRADTWNNLAFHPKTDMPLSSYVLHWHSLRANATS